MISHKDIRDSGLFFLHPGRINEQQVCPSKESRKALTGVARWIKHQPVNQRVTGSNPSQGMCLGCRPGSPVWGTQEATTHGCFSSSLSPSFPLCLKLTNKIFKKKKTESWKEERHLSAHRAVVWLLGQGRWRH